MRTRVVLAIVASCAPLALAACPQFASDFTVGSSTTDATSGDETKAPDGAADVGDAGLADASGEGSLDSSVDGFADSGTDATSADAPISDAQEEGPATLCCVSPAGQPNNCPVDVTVYSCNLMVSPGAECSTDGGTIAVMEGTTKVSASCWIWWGNDSGTWGKCEDGSNICCQGTVEGCD